MFRKERTKYTLVAVAFIIGLVMIPGSRDSDWCSRGSSVMERHTSVNGEEVACASGADDWILEVSWLSWISGKSSTYQFHFLDLLELLYGKGD
ncbi:hypothetical protein DXV75_06900 [Alteromonas aestuariivivens]|uniref:Uncharacterized protein n=1 Tax=Alteromonas aestuariivivens TaxID=1938339 RepID=A0A3D8MAI3_9ALTE|nr:hypothetical protein [Alteromonas aestuariivivens]RDV26708.1 hypothetical protein DXV75_06900 [Alteromonas aestuariivivens]